MKESNINLEFFNIEQEIFAQQILRQVGLVTEISDGIVTITGMLDVGYMKQ